MAADRNSLSKKFIKDTSETVLNSCRSEHLGNLRCNKGSFFNLRAFLNC